MMNRISSIIATVTYTSYEPLNNLSLTSYSELSLDDRATGTYLLLRILEPPVEYVGIQTVAEDHIGSVFLLTLYNFISHRLGTDPECALPTGTVIILKEPFLKISLDGTHRIRCDSPSDVVIVGRTSPHHAMASQIKWKHFPAGKPMFSGFIGQSAEEWKSAGNDCYKKQRYNEAREAYSVALQIAEQQVNSSLRATICINMAQCCLATEYFENALQVRKPIAGSHQAKHKLLLCLN